MHWAPARCDYLLIFLCQEAIHYLRCLGRKHQRRVKVASAAATKVVHVDSKNNTLLDGQRNFRQILIGQDIWLVVHPLQAPSKGLSPFMSFGLLDHRHLGGMGRARNRLGWQ